MPVPPSASSDCDIGGAKERVRQHVPPNECPRDTSLFSSERQRQRGADWQISNMSHSVDINDGYKPLNSRESVYTCEDRPKPIPRNTWPCVSQRGRLPSVPLSQRLSCIAVNDKNVNFDMRVRFSGHSSHHGDCACISLVSGDRDIILGTRHSWTNEGAYLCAAHSLWIVRWRGLVHIYVDISVVLVDRTGCICWIVRSVMSRVMR